MPPRELARRIAITSATCGVAVLLAYLLGGVNAALVIGGLSVPVAWFIFGFAGLTASASVVMLTIAALLLADSVFQREGSQSDLIRREGAALRQARRNADATSRARMEADELRAMVAAERGLRKSMTRRANRSERRVQTLQSALKRTKRTLKQVKRPKAKKR